MSNLACKLFNNLLESKENAMIDLDSSVKALQKQLDHIHFLIVSSSNKITNTNTIDCESAKRFADAKSLERQVFMIEHKIKALTETSVTNNHFTIQKQLQDYFEDTNYTINQNYEKYKSKLDYIYFDFNQKLNNFKIEFSNKKIIESHIQKVKNSLQSQINSWKGAIEDAVHNEFKS